MTRLLLFSLACLPVCAPLAMAQNDEDPRIEDVIIVTAPGKARAAAELIGSASAINRDELVDRLGGSLGDTLDHLPGVTSTSFGAASVS